MQSMKTIPVLLCSIALVAVICLGAQAQSTDNDDLTNRCWSVLEKAVKDGDTDTRRSAVILAGTLDTPQSLPIMERALRDDSDFVREGVLFALGKMRKTDCEALIRKALASPSESLQGAALQVIGESGRLNDLTLLKDYYNHKGSGLLKLYAASSIGLLGDLSCLPYIRKAATSDNADMRKEAIFFLGRLKDTESVPLLKKALKDSDREIYRRALLALGYYKDSSTIDTFIEALKSSDDAIRGAAVMSLGRLNSDEARAALINALGDKDWRVRSDVLDIITAWPAEAVLPIMKKAVDDPHYMISIKACTALALKGDKDALQKLISNLSSDDEFTRKYSARALGEIKNTEIIDSLKPLLDDESTMVRSEAACSLLKIIGGEKK